MSRAPCVRCGNPLFTEDGRERVTVSFTVEELVDLAINSCNEDVRTRLACAVGLLDPEAEKQIWSTLDALYR